MECWMLRGVRLMLSNNPDDYSKLYQMVQDSLDPETEHKIIKMPLKEALQDVPIKPGIKIIQESQTKKNKNVELVNQSALSKPATKRPFPFKEIEEGDKKKMQLLNMDLFGPSNISGLSESKRKRAQSTNVTLTSKDKMAAPDSIVTADLLSTEAIQEFSDLHCQICHFLTVSADNMIIECHQCRNLYHQKCHQPPVAQSAAVQLNWRCSKCIEDLDPDATDDTDKCLAPIDLTVSNQSCHLNI